MTAALELATAPELSGAPPADTRPAGGETWRRELEKAAAGGWFHGPVGFPVPDQDADAPPGKISHGETGLPCESSQHARTAGAVRDEASGQLVFSLSGGGARVVPPGTLQGASRRAAEPELSLPSRTAPPLLPDLSGRVPAVRAEPPGSLETVAAPNCRNPGAHPTTAVRFHVESGPGGVSVWLGLDGDPATVAARAGAILSELRSLPGANRRLASVVCNGASIYTAAAGPRHGAAPPSRETSWP